jgi:hypothetical protein
MPMSLVVVNVDGAGTKPNDESRDEQNERDRPNEGEKR